MERSKLKTDGGSDNIVSTIGILSQLCDLFLLKKTLKVDISLKQNLLKYVYVTETHFFML